LSDGLFGQFLKIMIVASTFGLLLLTGVDIMITIFCDFSQFSAKKLAFFSKTNIMIKILHNLALLRVKNADFFAIFFGKIFEKS
jgi:hypothetical protein